MKHWMTVFTIIVFLGIAINVRAGDETKMKDAEGRVKKQLPAEPPKESTGTVKGPKLTKPDPNRKSEPKFKEPPAPKVNKISYQSTMEGADDKIKEQLPAEPPKESTGTVKGSKLTKPDPNRKSEPKFKEPPSPDVKKKDKK
ncbi:MAG: hypothetical protein AB1638_07870 [Nitrospirota bacterium]